MAFSWLLAYLGTERTAHNENVHHRHRAGVAPDAQRKVEVSAGAQMIPTGTSSLTSTLPSAPPGPGEGWALGAPWRGLAAARGPNTGENPRVNDSVYNTRSPGEE
jgi:hypothetical protein